MQAEQWSFLLFRLLPLQGLVLAASLGILILQSHRLRAPASASSSTRLLHGSWVVITPQSRVERGSVARVYAATTAYALSGESAASFLLLLRPL